MRGHRLLLCSFVTVIGTATLLAQAPDSTALVRLSYVQGQVSILQGNTTQFDQAQANMPLFDGNTLSTGQDGQAEVEFVDGSVARVTPESQLRLVHLPGADASRGVTEIEMVSGLGYLELNTTNGQHYKVDFGGAVAQPAENSIFRINLDNAPELAVFAGSVRVYADAVFDQTVSEGNSIHFQAGDPSSVTNTQNIAQDSWDRWNQDRDDQIAREAQQQTSARETSGATNQPGWDDLDYYGDWYPMEGYGNVWVPNDVPSGWDPYSSGYWANYPSWGYTWISAYPWGWLPYHCGAWNYWNDVGWGWVPGQCGLGWWPTVTIWNAPSGFRLPPRPIPGGHIGQPTATNRLIAVNRGPALPLRGYSNTHTQPIRVEGQRVDPLPVLAQNPTLGGRLSYRGSGGTVVGTPSPVVGRSYGYAGNGGNGGARVVGPVMGTGMGVRPNAPAGSTAGPPPAASPRPVFRPTAPAEGSRPPAPTPLPRVYTPPPMPQPRVYTPPPAPRMSAPPPAPRMSAPSAPPPAPHVSGPAPSGHR